VATAPRPRGGAADPEPVSDPADHPTRREPDEPREPPWCRRRSSRHPRSSDHRRPERPSPPRASPCAVSVRRCRRRPYPSSNLALRARLVATAPRPRGGAADPEPVSVPADHPTRREPDEPREPPWCRRRRAVTHARATTDDPSAPARPTRRPAAVDVAVAVRRCRRQPYPHRTRHPEPVSWQRRHGQGVARPTPSQSPSRPTTQRAESPTSPASRPGAVAVERSPTPERPPTTRAPQPAPRVALLPLT
jgi:hypothetical protein